MGIRIWWKKFISPTPKGWVKVRNFSVGGIVTLTAMKTGIVDVTAPEWFDGYVWYIYAFLLIIGLIAQSNEKTKKEE